MPVNKRRLLISIIFILNIPILILWLSYKVLFANVKFKSNIIIEDQIFFTLDRLESIAKDPDAYFSQIFSSIELKASKITNKNNFVYLWKNELYKIINSLPNKYKSNFEFFIFDYEKENTIINQTKKVIPNKLMKKFFKAYRNFINNQTPLNATEISFLKTFFGNLLSPNERIDQRVIYASSNPEKIYLYISSPNEKIIVCVFIKVQIILSDIALFKETKSLLSKYKNFKISILNSENNIIKALHKHKIPPNLHSQIVNYFNSNLSKKIWIDNIFATLRVVIPNRYIFISYNNSNQKEYNIIDINLYFISSSIIFSLLPFIINLLFPNIVDNILKLKLIIPFSIVYNSILPLFLLGYASYIYIQEKEQNLLDHKLQHMVRTLDNFDRKFEYYLMCEKQKIYHHYTNSKYNYYNYNLSNKEDLKKLVTNLYQDYKFDICQIYDENGTIIYKYIDKESRLNPYFLTNTLSEISKISISSYKLNNKNSAHKQLETKQNTSDPFAKALLGKSVTSFSYNTINISQFEIYIASIPLTDKNLRNFYLAFLIWDRNTVEKKYVFDELENIKGTFRDLRIVALNILTPNYSFPKLKKMNKFYKLARQFSGSEIGYKRIINNKNKGYKILLTGVKGIFLSKYSLVGWCTDADIKSEISTIKNLIFICGGFWLIITVFASIILTNQFIKPLIVVEDALLEIEKRNFNHKITLDTSSEEFAKIATLFNQTFENLKDLEIARIVQETLFPKEVLKINSYEVFGTCISATQVGGDFFDYYFTDNSKIIAILGDVSGHGIGSALVVAMIKAIRTHPNLINNDNPAELLKNFHSVIFKILKRKKMMTCCIVAIEIQTQSIQIANSGQCYPAIVRNNKAELIEVSGLPLGSSKVWKFQTKNLELRHNDYIILYSDGLIEALDCNNQQIGYERFCSNLPNLLSDDIKQTERNIREWFAKISPYKPPADDVSVLIIKYG